MKYENGKPTQAESHNAQARMNYISWIIKLKKNANRNFSDNSMIVLLAIYSPNTLRKIRQELLTEKTIQKTTTKLPNNEKEYEITDMKKLNQLYCKYKEIFVNKHTPIIHTTPKQSFLPPYTNLEDHFILKFESNNKNKLSWYTPKQLFLKSVCPICNKKLRDFKHTPSHKFDRKCFNCHHTFFFDDNNQTSQIVRVVEN